METLKSITFGMMTCMVAFLFSGCSASDEPVGFVEKDPIIPDAEMNTYLDAQRSAAWEVFEQIVDYNAESNIAFSPLSLYVALSMTSAGAPDECLEELNNFFHYNVSPRFHNYNKQILSTLPYLDNQTKLKLANSVWVLDKVGFNPTFQKDMNENYFADANILNKDDDMARVINNWISANTEGLIPKHLDKDVDCSLMLINALYFKSIWNTPFDKSLTKDDTFHHADGSKSMLPFMNGKLICEHSYFKGGEVLTLPFHNKKFKISFYLPSQLTEISQFAKNTDLKIARQSTINTELEISLPKFEIDSKLDLIPILHKMGLTKIFKERVWPGLTREKQEMIVNHISQSNVINIDENGGEAASSSSVGMIVTDDGSGKVPTPQKFVLNHPAVFEIWETSTNLPILIGTIE